MVELHLRVVWICILLGMATGAIQGMFFHREDWLGGYGSWKRRMLRLAHISFFGFAFLNLVFANTVGWLGAARYAPWMSQAFLAGAGLMPAICYLAAWRQPLRMLFYPLVTGLVGASLLFIFGGIKR
ncbi:MAG: hypothetical protein KGN80_07440 [Acidobacteriota bacterium]|nr:hypothetical protein [Acidobacteriota bacterium]